MLNYSFLSVHFAFTHPLMPVPFVSTGSNALGGITVTNAQDHTVPAVTVDGTVINNYKPGDNGGAQIQCSQVSGLQQWLVTWHNAVKAAADAGDLTEFSTGTIIIRDLNTSALHTLQGVSPNKIPDKVYGGEAQMVTWTLPAAKVINE